MLFEALLAGSLGWESSAGDTSAFPTASLVRPASKGDGRQHRNSCKCLNISRTGFSRTSMKLKGEAEGCQGAVCRSRFGTSRQARRLLLFCFIATWSSARRVFF